MIVGSCLGDLSAVEWTNAECTVSAVVSTSCVTSACMDIGFRYRRVCVDPAAETVKAELGIAQYRPPRCHLLWTRCEVHVCSGCHAKAMWHVLVRLALSLQVNGMTTRLRQAVAQVFAERLVTIVGSPPWQALVHREAALRVFCSGPRTHQRHHLLTHLHQSDWRYTSAVEYCIAPEKQGVVTRGKITTACRRGLQSFFAVRGPACTPSTGGRELIVQYLALLAVCHGVLERAYHAGQSDHMIISQNVKLCNALGIISSAEIYVCGVCVVLCLSRV